MLTEDANCIDAAYQLRCWLLAGAAAHRTSLEQASVAVHADDFKANSIVIVH